MSFWNEYHSKQTTYVALFTGSKLFLAYKHLFQYFHRNIIKTYLPFFAEVIFNLTISVEATSSCLVSEESAVLARLSCFRADPLVVRMVTERDD